MDKKTKLPIIQIAIFTLIFFSIYSIINIFRLYPYNFEIKGLYSPLEKITINLEFKQKTTDDFFFCFNDFCTTAQKDYFSNVYTINFDNSTDEFYKKKVENIYLAYPKKSNLAKNIKMIDFHSGTKNTYLNNQDIQKLNKKTFKIETNGTLKEYSAIQIPYKSNYRGILNHFCILFLSLFYSANIFIIPYFWLFVAYLLYFFNKDKFKFKLNQKCYFIIFSLILILGAILRINEITYHPLWLDEIYTKTVAISSFKSCFQDAGNPPIFYILEFIVSEILNNSDFYLKLIPLISGVLFPFGIYLIFKNINKPSAFLMMFLASINTINIYHSQEIRSYSLSMTLGVFCIYFLFEYFKKQNNKNLIHYFLTSIFLIYLHYYNFLFIVFNALFGLIKIKDKKEKIKFIIFNLISLFSILPFILYTFNKTLTNNFNKWIEPVNLSTFKYIINEYFNNKYIFTLFLTIIFIYIISIFIDKFFKKLNLDNEKKELFLYSLFSTIFIIFSTTLISIFFKPILHKRLLLANYELLFLLEGALILGIYQIKKYIPIKIALQTLIIFIFISTIKPMPLREIYVLNDFMDFVNKDSIQYQNDYEIHCFTNDTKKYLNNFNDLKSNKQIIWHYVNSNSMEYIKKISKKDFIKPNKKGIIYLHDMSADIDKIGFLNIHARIYHTNSIRNLKIIYE